MDTNKKTVIALVLTIVAASIIGYVILTDVKKDKNGQGVTDNSLPYTVNTNTDTDFQSDIVVPESEQRSGAEASAGIPVPDLDRAVRVPDSYSVQQREELTKQINGIVSLLKQDATLFNEWSDLGLLLKEVGDYEGARQAWEYASGIRSKNSLSFANLGVLYGYYLNDSVAAEKNYLKAIENDPKLPYLYGQAADFYLEVLKNKDKARTILEQGLLAIPGDNTLKIALENIGD